MSFPIESEQTEKTTAEMIVGSSEDYAMFVMDRQGIILSWNPGVRHLLQFTEDDFIGQSAAMLYTPEDLDAGIFQQEMERARHAGKTPDRCWHVRQDGTRFWSDGMLIVISEEQTTQRFVKIMRDDTDRKLLEDQVAKANHLKDVFLATLAHELRTPLMAILGWTQVLREDANPEMVEVAVGIIEQNALTQSRLVEDLLELARIASAKIALNRHPIDLGRLVDGAVESMRPVIREKGLQLDVLAGGTPIIISGDPDRLRQVIGNLLTNALKFTPPRGSIRVQLTRASGEAQVIVSDTGKGINPTNLEAIFEPFRQGEAPGRSSGSGLGLGLSIARQLVELHDGRIAATSEGLGKGASFTVSLPLIGE